MNSDTLFLLLEALVVFGLVLGLHALRRQTSIVYSYAFLTFLTFGSWVTPYGLGFEVGPLAIYVGSGVFFTGSLLGVFVMYVADGPRAGRLALAVCVGTAVLYAATSAVLLAQFNASDAIMTQGSPALGLPNTSLRSAIASIIALILDLVALGVCWEFFQSKAKRLPLLAKVTLTLYLVFTLDVLLYITGAFAGEAGFTSMFQGGLLARAVLAFGYAPIVTWYLKREIRVHGLELVARPVLSILTKEDLENELVSTRHSLEIGTEALWESEERYRRVVEDIPTMVFRFSVEGTVTYANPAIRAYYTEGKVLGEYVLSVIDKKHRVEAWQRVQGLTLEQPTIDFTVPAFRAPGDRRIQRWIVRGIFKEDGTPTAYQAVGEDVTDKHNAEEIRRKLSAAIDQANDSVAIIDPKGRIEFANSCMLRRSGQAKEEVIGQTIDLVLKRVADAEAYMPLLEAAAGGHGWSGTIPMIVGDGDPSVQRVTAGPVVSAEGQVMGHVFIARDVTREKQVEAHMHQTETMEAIGLLAGGVAHDFGNLIMVIWACSEIVSLELGLSEMEVPAEVTRALEDIRQGADRAAMLTKHLMAVSRQDSSDPELMCLSEVVKNMAGLLGRLLPVGVDLQIECGTGIGRVLADSSQIERVLINLVLNARDAMGSEGKIIVRTRQQEVDSDYQVDWPESTPGPHAVLIVSDTGSGMDEETCQHIFEPFFTTKESGRGTGLGLSSAYGIAQQAKGHLRVESELGIGSSFMLYLPCDDSEIADSGLLKPVIRRNEGVVVYCESEVGVRNHVRQLLESGGYEVRLASNVADTARELAAHIGSPKVLLADMLVGGMSGPDLIDCLRIDFPNLPAVLFSGGIQSESRVATLINAQLVKKPVHTGELLTAVAAGLASHKPSK